MSDCQGMNLVIQQISEQAPEARFGTVQAGSDVAADLFATMRLKPLDLALQVGALIM